MRYALMIAFALLMAACDDSGGGGSGGSSNPPVGGPGLEITTTWLPVGWYGSAYSATLEATGGTGTGYTWSIVQGALPSGVTLQTTGTPQTTITGAPVSTTYLTHFTLQVTDSAGATATRVLNLPVVSWQGGPGAIYEPGPYLLVCDVSAATTGAVNATIRSEVEFLISDMLPTDEFDIIVYSDRFANGYLAMCGTPQLATSANVAAAVAWVQRTNFDAGGNAANSMHDAWEFAYSQYNNIRTPLFLYHDVGTSAAAILGLLPIWAGWDPARHAFIVGASPTPAGQQFGQDAANLVGGTYIGI